MITIPDEIKALLKKDGTRKNFRVSFPNGERDDIINEDIVSESLSFTESIASRDFRFGACETPYVEFSTFGIGNIKGYEIECHMEVFCDGTVSGAVYREDLSSYVYPVLLGNFTVASSRRQSLATTERKIIAYANDLSSLPIGKGEKMKETYGNATKDTAYTVDVQDTVLSMYGFDKHAGTYTDLSFWTDPETGATKRSAVLHFYSTAWGDSVTAGVVCLAYELDTVAKSKLLYWADYPKAAKTIDAVAEEISLTTEQKEAVSKYLDPFIAFGAGIQSALGNIPCDSHYIYPDMGMAAKEAEQYYGGSIFTGYICIPVSVFFSEYGEMKVYRKADIRSEEECKLQLAELDDQLGLSISISRTKFTDTDSLGQTVTSYRVADANLMDASEVVEAYFELTGRFVKTMRDGSVKAFSLPAEGEAYDASMVSEIWADDGGTKPYGRIFTEYTKGDGSKANLYLYIIPESSWDSGKYLTYTLSSNYLIRTNSFTEEALSTLLSGLSAALDGFTYMPVSMTAVGLPEVEAGDKVTVIAADGSVISSYVLSRTLSGIQCLTDRITASADEENVDYASVQETTSSTSEIEGQITVLQNSKQDKLTAGSGITISSDNVISASGGGSLGSDFILRDAYSKSITLAAGATVLTSFATTDRTSEGYTHIASYMSAGTQYYNLEFVSGTGSTASTRIRITSTRSQSTTANVSLVKVWVKSDYVTETTTSL